MNNEDKYFVSNKIALQLKSLKFNDTVYQFFRIDDKSTVQESYASIPKKYNTDKNTVSQPTVFDVMLWLERKHSIYIQLDIDGSKEMTAIVKRIDKGVVETIAICPRCKGYCKALQCAVGHAVRFLQDKKK